MIQFLFNINLVLAYAVFAVGGFMLVGVALDAMSNAKNKQS
jgi:hypothetical protein